jgi:hypothetical protein
MKATRATIRQRVEELLAIRLDGAEFWDIRQYVSEKQAAGEAPWAVPEGDPPLCDRTLWRYLAEADRLIAESCRGGRKKLLRRHLAQRRNLYAKAVSAGDIRVALAAAESEARLQGLFDIPARTAKLEPIKTPEDVLRLVASTIADLRAGRLDNKTAATVGALAGSWLRAMGVEVLDKRLEALQAVLLGRKDKDKGR